MVVLYAAFTFGVRYAEGRFERWRDIAALKHVAEDVYAKAPNRPAQVMLAMTSTRPQQRSTCGFVLFQSPNEIALFTHDETRVMGGGTHSEVDLYSASRDRGVGYLCDVDGVIGDRPYSEFRSTQPPPDPTLLKASIAKVQAYQACMARNFKAPDQVGRCLPALSAP